MVPGSKIHLQILSEANLLFLPSYRNAKISAPKFYGSENYNLMFSIFKTLVFSFIFNSGQWISKILLIKLLPDNFFLSRYFGRISYLIDGGYRCFNHTYTFIVAMFPLEWHFMVRTNTHVCTVSGRSSFCNAQSCQSYDPTLSFKSDKKSSS